MSDISLKDLPGMHLEAGNGAQLVEIVSPPLAVDHPPIGKAVELSLYTSLGEVEQEWKAFETRADCTAFQTFDWLAAWQRHVGTRHGTRPAIVFGRDAERRLMLILPLAVERWGVVRHLSWLGSALCDYNGPLLAEDFSRRIGPDEFARLWGRAIELVRSNPHLRFDFTDLQKMPETVGGQKNPLLALPVLAHPSGAYVATLSGKWDDFYAAKRSASTRKRERKQLKQLAEHGEVKLLTATRTEDIRTTMSVLFEQKARSFARMGVENLFSRPGYREFFLDVAGDPGSHVSRLDVGSIMAAANLGLKFRDCYYLILSSYYDGELARFGPGRAHLHEIIRHAIACGLRRFDFTIGDEPYKRDWSDTEVAVFDHLAVATWRGWVVVGLTVAYRRTKRLIKQTPVLWRAFSKARTLGVAATGRLRARSTPPAEGDTCAPQEGRA
jgi:CelD/BcsL family acetyltransferase involved in cellulose biosynthesis